jgi:hypothetical protein
MRAACAHLVAAHSKSYHQITGTPTNPPRSQLSPRRAAVGKHDILGSISMACLAESLQSKSGRREAEQGVSFHKRQKQTAGAGPQEQGVWFRAMFSVVFQWPAWLERQPGRWEADKGVSLRRRQQPGVWWFRGRLQEQGDCRSRDSGAGCLVPGANGSSRRREQGEWRGSAGLAILHTWCPCMSSWYAGGAPFSPGPTERGPRR